MHIFKRICFSSPRNISWSWPANASNLTWNNWSNLFLFVLWLRPQLFYLFVGLHFIFRNFKVRRSEKNWTWPPNVPIVRSSFKIFFVSNMQCDFTCKMLVCPIIINHCKCLCMFNPHRIFVIMCYIIRQTWTWIVRKVWLSSFFF